MSYTWSIALRYLRSKKRSTISIITVIAVAGVALGVAALLTVLSITTGFQEEFRNKVLGVNAHVLVLKYGLDFSEYDDVIFKAQQMPEVQAAAPFLIHEMMLAKGTRLSGVLIKGVDPRGSSAVLDLPRQLVKGSLKGLRVPGAKPPSLPTDEELKAQLDNELDLVLQGLEPRANQAHQEMPSNQKEKSVAVAHVPTPEQAELSLQDANSLNLPSDELEAELFGAKENTDPQDTVNLPGLVLGITLAENLAIKVGDVVRVVSPLSGLDTSMWSPNGGAPKSKNFVVIGIFHAGFQEYDTRLVYVDLYEAQAFFYHGDTVTGVEMSLHDIESAPRVARQLEHVLGQGPYHTLDWRELNHNLFTALEIQKIMLSLVIATIIFVAAFNVIATLIMMVLDKKREIAILKAIGAKDRSILSIFVFQGSLIGTVGTLIGLVLGGGVCWYLTAHQFPLDPKVYLINHLPVRMSGVEFMFTIATSLGITAIATVIPSLWAAKMLPADGLRYD